MLNTRLHSVIVAVLFSASLVACGGGNDSGGDSGANADRQADTFKLSPATFEAVLPGESIEASAKISGFDETLQATFTTEGPITATLRNGKSGKEAETVEFKSGDTIFAKVLVNEDAAVAENFSLQLTVGSGDAAVSTALKGTVGDDADPVMSIHFPPDRSVTIADKISVTGSASDNAGIASITVNGAPANFDADTGLWELAESPLDAIGGNDIVVEAKDVSGRITTRVLDIFRYNDGLTYAQAFEENYLGSVDVPAPSTSEAATVDAVTGKIYLGHEAGGGFTLVEVDPETGHGRNILSNAVTASGADLIRQAYPMAAHNGVAYFYTLYASDPTPANDDDDYDGIYRAVLSECTGATADLSCVHPFAINGIGATDTNTHLMYDLDASLFIRQDKHELWVFNAGDSASGIEEGGLVRIALEDGAFVGTPKPIDAGNNKYLVLQGDILYDANSDVVNRYDVSAAVPDTTETPVSRCDDAGAPSPSSNCPDDDIAAIGTGPMLFYQDVALVAHSALFARGESWTLDASGALVREYGFYGVDLATGNRNFLLGEHFDTGVQVSRGEVLSNLSTAKLLPDAERQRVYVWSEGVLMAINIAEVTDPATGEKRLALDTVRVAEE